MCKRKQKIQDINPYELISKLVMLLVSSIPFLINSTIDKTFDKTIDEIFDITKPENPKV